MSGFAPISLRARLVGVLLIVAAVGGAGLFSMAMIERSSANDALEDTSLATQAQKLVKGLRFDGRGGLVRVKIAHRWRKAYATAGAAYFTVYDPGGRPVRRSANLAAPLARQPLSPDQSQSPLAVVGPGQDLSLTERAPHGYQIVVGRTNPGALVEAHPDPFEDFLPLMLFAGMGALTLLVVWIMVGWSLRPLRRASREAARIGPDAVDVRLTRTGLPAEVRPLVEAVNGALDRVAAAYAAERRFTADAVHALRTPVAVMDLRLQRVAAAAGPEAAALREDLAQISQLVNGLLSLARAEQAERRLEPVNLARVLRETAAGLQPAVDLEARLLVVEAPKTLEVRAESRGLRDLIEALLDNALRHGSGAVTARLTVADGRPTLTVEDEGAGVPADLWERVFERFQKLDVNSPGAGLGLAIVRQTARALGGDARLIRPATVQVMFPRLAASAAPGSSSNQI